MQKKLTKAEIVENIFQKTNCNKRDLFVIIEAFFDEIKNALTHGRIAELRGFGTFEVHLRNGRKARNPKTGEKVDTDDHGVVFFRPGQELKSLVWDIVDITQDNSSDSDGGQTGASQ